MAPTGRLLLIIVLVIAVHLTEPKDGHRTLSRSRSGSRRTYRGRTYTSYNTYYTGSTYRQGLSWWQIALIIGGIIFVFIIIYICVRACRNQEPDSDTPGINTTRDQIQLRDHQTVNHFSNANYTLCSNGREIPPPQHIQNAPYQPQQMATAPPPSYDDAVVISKKPMEGADEWEDEPEINRKEFGVI